MEEPVFVRLAALEVRRQNLEVLAATPAELEPISRGQLEELRHLSHPPQAVRDCLDVVFAALHVDSTSKRLRAVASWDRISFDWRDIQRMLTRYDSFFPAMQNYDLATLLDAPTVVQYLSITYFDTSKPKSLTEERVQQSCVAAAALFRWCGHTVARAMASLELLVVNAEIAEIQRREELPAETAENEEPVPVIDRPAWEELPLMHEVWDRELSNPDLELSPDQASAASSATSLFEEDVGFGETAMQQGTFRIPIIYDRGTFLYLCVGVCQVGQQRDAWDVNGNFKNEWLNGRHRGCYMYSFFYNQFSMDGAEWKTDPNSLGPRPNFKPGDQLIMDLDTSSGSLTFFYKQQGQQTGVLLGRLQTQGLVGEFRVIALLGSGKQSVSFGRS